MVTVYYHPYFRPLVLINQVVDDFGDLLSLVDDAPGMETFDAAWRFAKAGGACLDVTEGEFH